MAAHSTSLESTAQTATNGAPPPSRHEQASEINAQLDRSTAYQSELLNLFQQRLSLLCSMALLLLPFFALLHAILSPQTRREVAMIHLGLVILCAATRFCSVRVENLRDIRILALFSYALFAIGAALVGAYVSQPHLDAPIANSFVTCSAFSQIMLSLLILPFGLWEAVAIVLVVMGAMCGSFSVLRSLLILQDSGGAATEPLFWSHLFVLGATSFVVLCLAHLNTLQRLSAFDAAWQLALSARKLEELSVRDIVTGGWNRHYLECVLGDEIARAARFKRDLSVLMFDLDAFKTVNDTHGHVLGDEVLREVHQATLHSVREIDTVARYGGDEFFVVLPETPASAAISLAQRLQNSVTQRLIERWDANHIAASVTLSIGIWTQPPDTAPQVQDVIAQADEKLYSAKRSGKNCIAV